jgi:hypothetical protein
MKKVAFVTVIVAFAIQVKAQNIDRTYEDDDERMDKMFIWSIGIEPSVPVGNFNNYSMFGLGGSVQGEYKPSRMVGITVNAGYLDYFGTESNGISYSDFHYWPVMGGLKLYMGKMAYIHGQAGAGFGAQDLGNSFWYGGGVGLNLSKAIDLEVRYTGWEQNEVESSETGGGPYGGGSTGGNGNGGGGYGGHYSTIGLRLAYNF